MDEATRRWLISPQGLLAACREAAIGRDAAFLDKLATSALLGVLDDECLQAPGPAPSDRALALVCAGRLALWCLQGRDRPAAIEDWLAVAVNGLSGPADARWDPPVGGFDLVAALTVDPRAAATAVVVAAHAAGAPTAAVLAVGDLVHAFLPVSHGPGTSPHIRVPLLTSRHDRGELVHLGAVSRPGPPGIALDLLVCPFTRADAAFHQAVTTAWHANRSPSLSARWSVISDRTGVAVEVIGGRSVGAAAGTALRYLTHPGLTPLDRSWAVTGALDATGALVSLLDDDHNLATYRTKLMAAGDRTVVVPTCDHPHVAVLVESGALNARLVPAASLVEITDAARRDASAQAAHNAVWERSPRLPPALVSPGSPPASPPSVGRLAPLAMWRKVAGLITVVLLVAVVGTIVLVHPGRLGTVSVDGAGTAIPVGFSPSAIAITPDGATAYVANGGDNTVTPITVATGTPGTPIPVGQHPSAIAITPDGATAYVVNSFDDTMTPITVATGTPGTPIPVVGVVPTAIAITPNGATVYLATYGTLTPITVATGTPGTPIPAGPDPHGIAITPNGATAYVANGYNTVTPITLATGTPGTPIRVGRGPNAIAITPDGATAYVVNSFDDTMTPITVATGTPGTPIPVGRYPSGIAITPNGATAYVTNNPEKTVTPITLATGTPGTPIPAPYPKAIAITPNGATAYVTSGADNTVSRISLGTGG